MKQDNRPVNLDLTRFAFPITSVTSITHRVAGVALFVGVILGLYLLDVSLSSQAGFERVAAMLTSPFGKLVSWVFLSALAYHFVAGIKHLLQDLEIGVSLEGGLFASKATIVLSAILIGVLAAWVLQW